MAFSNQALLAGWLLAAVTAQTATAQTATAQTTTAQITPQAQAPPTVGQVAEVVVTAQKRAENIETVPLSITARSGAQLADAGIDEPTQLRKITPDLQIIPIAQAAGVILAIRGFGSASSAAIDPDVAPYIDGVFIPRPGAAMTSFLDVNNVEVLRGPQGTLFGRNSTVGAISITTNAPSFTAASASASAQVASYATFETQGVGNLPVTDTLALRGAVLVGGTDGFIHNSFDHREYGADDHELVRVSGKWLITPALTWLLRVDDARTTGDGVNYNAVDTASASPAQLAAYRARLGSAAATLSDPPSFSAHQRFDASLTDTQWGVSSDLDWTVGGGFALRLIDSFRDWINEQSDGDLIYTALDLLGRNDTFASRSQSHELQLISPQRLLADRLSFVAGLYYFRETYAIDTAYDVGADYCPFVIAAAVPVLLPACNAGPHADALTSRFDQVEDSLAGYLQGDVKLPDALTLTLGGRVTHDRKEGAYLTQVSNPAAVLLGAPEDDPRLSYSKTQPTYRANLSWQATPTVMGFASYSTGYKSGGFSSAISTPALTVAARTFRPETSRDYEIGVKSTFFDRRLLVNADLFQTEITNFQDRTYNGVTLLVRNSGDIRARGVELEGEAVPTDYLTLVFSVDYLDSIYSSFIDAPGLPACTGAPGSCPTTQNLTGRETDLAPPYQADIAAEYASPTFWDGYRMKVRPDVSCEAGFYSTNDLNPQGYVKPHALLGLRVSLVSPSQRFTITAYGTNLTGARYFTDKFPEGLDSLLGGSVPATGATLYRGYLGDPLEVGLKVEGRF